jgi:hypothetical protein
MQWSPDDQELAFIMGLTPALGVLPPRPAPKPPKSTKPKKPLIAREAFWGDIPEWGEEDGCMILDLPCDILDRCFGMGADLEVCVADNNGSKAEYRVTTVERLCCIGGFMWDVPTLP